jgi:hypothetical protein
LIKKTRDSFTEGGFMNRLIYGFVILCVLVLAGSQAMAQITISAADIQGQFAADSTKRYFDTTSTRQVGIGDTIGATSWDFTALRNDSSWSVLYVQPSSTPYAGDFPAAGLAQKANISINIPSFGVSAVGTAYEYYKLDTYFVDFGIKGSGTVGGILSGTVDWTKIPADTLYKLPMTLRTQWGSTDSAITVIDVPGFLYHSRSAVPEFRDIIVDAYGTMTLPDATVHQALRIRKTSRMPATPTSYSFVARDGAYVNLSANDALAPLTGTIHVKNIIWGPAVFTPPTAIASTPTVPGEFSLSQNYPNPFNPSTLIRYGLPQGSQVRLEVYNVIGQNVATLVDERQEAGYHEVHFSGVNLPSGVYFYRLTAGGYVKTMKMALTK